jgi:hypothetical protein
MKTYKNDLKRELKMIKLAIKRECIDCMGGHKHIDCELDTCDLYSYRPWRKNELADKSNSRKKR